jgi:crotonobetainyl-CoA:carnitine CoA-transferase CaiB-like acyl-CoA transferase
MRTFGPPWIGDVKTGEHVDAAHYARANRGKRAITVDFGTAQGGKIVQRLAAKSDIVLENYKVGALARYELDYESLKQSNPGVIYCSITGFGQTGPYRNRPGYDCLIQGMGGLMSVTGERDGLPGGGPQRAGVALADIITGLYASSAILSALFHRERTGQGQYIDLTLLDSQVAVLANQGMNWLIGGWVPKRAGNGHPNIAPYQAFTTRDGHIILAVGNDEQFRRFCEACGHPEMGTDPKFATIAARNANRGELLPVVSEWIRGRSTGEWIELLERIQVPGGPINSIDRVFADPQVLSRGMRLDLPRPRADTLPSIANPIHFSETPIEYRHASPVPGQHMSEVLRELLGMSDADIGQLREKGVV